MMLGSPRRTGWLGIDVAGHMRVVQWKSGRRGGKRCHESECAGRCYCAGVIIAADDRSVKETRTRSPVLATCLGLGGRR